MPRQARSTASVDAILQATVQVLLKDGKAKLTTTRIAGRAGVSVGTLYQYFPNKRSLLKAVIQEHLDFVAASVETACREAEGESLATMAEAVTRGFVKAKFHDLDASIALYAVSDDVDGKRIARGMRARLIEAMVALLETTKSDRIAEPEAVAGTLLSAMAGVSRAMLEEGVTPGTMAVMEQQLCRMAIAYLQACALP